MLQTAFGPVTEAGRTFEVYLDPNGRFTTQYEGRDVSSESLDGLRKQLRAKITAAKRKQTRVEIPVAVIAPGQQAVNIVLTGTAKARGHGIGEQVLWTSSDRNADRLRGDRLSYYQDVYRPFPPEDLAEHARLAEAVNDAEAALETFLRVRKLKFGAGRTVAEAQEVKVPE